MYQNAHSSRHLTTNGKSVSVELLVFPPQPQEKVSLL
jgi:hypothetical protein